MSLISMLCPRCLGDSFERDHAYKCRPLEPAMTPTVPPSPAQGETAGVSEEQVHAMCNYLQGHRHKCPKEIDTAYGRGEQGCHAIALETLEKADAILPLRQQLADSAHEVERLNAANAAMRGAEHVAWLRYKSRDGGRVTIHLCDSDSDGAFKVYRHPGAALAPTSHDPVRSAGEARPVPSRGKPIEGPCNDVLPDNLTSTMCKRCAYPVIQHAGADCAQGGSPADDDGPGEEDGPWAKGWEGRRSERSSPPPTDDIVAGLRKVREYIAQGHYEYGGRGDRQLEDIYRAIAALEGADSRDCGQCGGMGGDSERVCPGCGGCGLAKLERPSPPPTDDIVAGLRKLLRNIADEIPTAFRPADDISADQLCLSRAIAALEGAK